MSGKHQEFIQNAGKCDDQHQYKEMIEEDIFSTTEVCNNSGPMTPKPYVSTKKPGVRKLLRQFSETLDVKYMTGVCRLVTAKAKIK